MLCNFVETVGSSFSRTLATDLQSTITYVSTSLTSAEFNQTYTNIILFYHLS